MTGITQNGFTLYSLGVIANDIEEDSVYVEIYPAVLNPGKHGNLMEPDELDVTSTSSNKEMENIKINNTRIIVAKWLPNGNTNRLEPPTVCKGELVHIFTFMDTNMYYWTPVFNELRLRKLEKITTVASNKRTIMGESTDLLSKIYYYTIDTINKFVRFHTDDSDGELTTYDYHIDTKNGNVLFTDGKGNFWHLESENEDLTTNINRDRVSTVGRDRTADIGNNDTTNVGKDKTLNVGNNDTTTIDNDKSLTVGGSYSTYIDNGKYVNVGTEYRIRTKQFTVNNDTCELISTLIEWLRADIDNVGVGNLGYPVPRSSETKAKYEAIISKLSTFL